MKLYQKIAQLLASVKRGEASDQPQHKQWAITHTDTIEQLCRDKMPSGSGFDCGTKLDFDKSTPDKLVFFTEYHHMNDNGMYDGWTSHTVTVKPSLQFGMEFAIGGRDRNGFKEYAYQCFEIALNEEVGF